MKRKIISLLLCAVLLASMCLLWSCGKDNVRISMEFEGYGTVVMLLDYENAPKTCANFRKLVKSGFYDGLTMHRIADLTGYDGWIVQGGDPDGNGSGGSDKNIVGEFDANGLVNELSHKRGTVSMARSNGYDSASSQFFICTGDCSFLDGNYAAFATVISGIEAVDAMVYDYIIDGTTLPVITKAEILK